VPLAREGVAVRRERAVENAIPRELGAGTGAPGVAHPTPEVTVPEQLGERGAKRGDVPRRNEQARLLVHDQVEQAADGGGDDRPAVASAPNVTTPPASAPRAKVEHAAATVTRAAPVRPSDSTIEKPHGDHVPVRPAASAATASASSTLRAPFMMGLRRRGAMGECEARTQGALVFVQYGGD